MTEITAASCHGTLNTLDRLIKTRYVEVNVFENIVNFLYINGSDASF